MKVLKSLLIRDAFLQIGEPWSFVIAMITFNTVIIAFWRDLQLTFVGTNLLIKYVELNVSFFAYVFFLCGLTALRANLKKSLALPLLFFPYIFTPLYASILTWLRLPRALSFTIAFVHSILLVREHDLLILSIRIAAYGGLLTVVRHWI